MNQLASRDAWYVQVGGNTFGPLTLEEVRAIHRSGSFEGPFLVSQNQATGWTPIEKLADLGGSVASLDKPGPEVDRRRKKRRALFAIVRFDSARQASAEGYRHAGTSRNVGVGGMMILSQKDPGPRGTRIFLSVTPLQGGMIGPFETEAEVAYVLTAEKGFGVRFFQLPDKARREIQHYTGDSGQGG